MTTPMNTPAVPKDFEAIGRWITTTLRLLQEQPKVWILQGLILLAFQLAFGAIAVSLFFLMIPGFSLIGLMKSADPSSISKIIESASPALIVAAVLALIGAILIFSFLLLYLSGGMIYTALKQLRGEQIEVTDIFRGGPATWSLFGAGFLMGLATFVGLLFCILPGLFIPVFFIFTLPAILDRRLGAMDGLSFSSGLVKQNYWLFFVYGAILFASNFAVSNIIGNIPFISVLSPIVGVAFAVITAIYFSVPYSEIVYGNFQGGPSWSTGPQPYVPPAYTPPSDHNIPPQN